MGTRPLNAQLNESLPQNLVCRVWVDVPSAVAGWANKLCLLPESDRASPDPCMVISRPAACEYIANLNDS